MNSQGKKSTVPGDNLREEQTNPAVSLNTAALIKFTRESDSWIPMSGPHIPSPKHTGSPGVDLDVALCANNCGQPDFSAVCGFVIDPIAGSPWSHLSLESRLVSLPRHGQLPLKAVALELVTETFNNYNRFLPLLTKRTS